MSDTEGSSDERPCLHCLIGETIENFYAEYGTLSGEKEAIDVDEIISALGQTMADLISGFEPSLRQQVIRVPTKFCIIIHNLAHQLFNQLLADRTVLTVRQFCHSLCNCCNHFVSINRVWLAACRRIFSKKIFDQLQHPAMKARSFL